MKRCLHCGHVLSPLERAYCDFCADMPEQAGDITDIIQRARTRERLVRIVEEDADGRLVNVYVPANEVGL